MSQGHDHGGHEEHAAHPTQAGPGHHGDVRNPDYDGPDRHCLPPEVRPSFPSSVYFILLMVAIAAGAAWLGIRLL